MRVAVDVTPLLGTRTGIGELVSGLVTALNDRDDVEVVPVALTWRGRQYAGAQHRPIPARLIQHLWARSDRLPMSRWTGSVDVVHGTNYVVGPPSHRQSQAPRIVTVHDLATVKTPHLCHPDTLVFPRLVRRAVESGAFVQTDSHAVANEVVDWLHIDSSRVRAIQPGIPALPTGDFSGLDPRLATHPFVLTIGTEDPRKGLTRVADVMSALHRARPELLWVHAGGTGWGTNELNSALQGLNVADRAAVVRLGRVSDDQRAWLLRHAEVFLYPSIDEGFGFPPLEALSVGTPVVAHDLPVFHEILGNTPAALVDTSDPELFVQSILAGPTIGAVADAIHSVSSYSWTEMASAQVSWYRDVQA
jgi:glycosyltransferase involved in cell wall biosynthesis